jgi:hypothetical protein
MREISEGCIQYEWYEWYAQWLDIAIKAAEDLSADCNPWGGCAMRSMVTRELRGLREKLASMGNEAEAPKDAGLPLPQRGHAG